MNTLNDAMKPCPFCGGKVEFHEEYPHCDGCHHIYCVKCGMFDLSTAADPLNQCETIDMLREKIIPLWNTRASMPESSNSPASNGAAQGKTEQCPTCRGNDADAPCAYPSQGMTGCLRDKRLAAKKG